MVLFHRHNNEELHDVFNFIYKNIQNINNDSSFNE